MSLKAIIKYRDDDGKRCARIEDFVAPIGGGQLGIYKDANHYTAAHEIINMAAPAFISVRWVDKDINEDYQQDVSFFAKRGVL